MLQIGKAAVLGAGTMGAAIAAHLANAGVPTILLDIAPQGEADKNKIVRAGYEGLKKARPAAYMNNDNANLLSVGNFEDDLSRIKDCDFVIEAVVENLELKRKLYEQVEKYRKPSSVIASNTSGIPIRSIAEGFSEDFRRNFFGIHFFNPPRYMKLVETIPTEWTDAEVLRETQEFLDIRLGKGVVLAKDRPNFIANRIGTFGMMATVHAMQEMGFTPTEVDQMTGKAIGHASSATFRTADLVGLDVLAHVNKNLYPAVPDDEDRDAFQIPDFLNKMLENKILGDKTKGGFYKKSTNAEGKREILELDLQTFEYKPQSKTKFPSIDAAKGIEDLPTRVKTLLWGKDRVGEFLWKTTSRTMRYAANRLPEIADTIVEIDNAIKWGFGWEIGVFEAWDAIGVKESVERMRAEGQPIPANIEKMLESGAASFYKTENGHKSYFDFATNTYKPVEDKP
ncbi:MAG TPA: 3-hydroxyacyl-CoA dehydrogenase family protein, partial [Pyrinomonadaceae bacterium]